MQLFPPSEYMDLNLQDATFRYFPNFFSAEEADNYFKTILLHTQWQQDVITVYGKTHKQPRLTAFYANNDRTLNYANITMYPHKFTKELLVIKHKVEDAIKASFTSCLLNLYRDGQDSNGWHSDDEKELGMNPVIASVSFGAERQFQLKHKTDKELKHKLLLRHGSLLLMKDETQHYWKHQIPKT